MQVTCRTKILMKIAKQKRIQSKWNVKALDEGFINLLVFLVIKTVMNCHEKLAVPLEN